MPVPNGFREEVEEALRSRQPGKLALLASEAKGSPWESEGLALVARARPEANRPAPPSGQPWVIAFTGHQVDSPGRKEPRFPASKEPVARAAIRDAVERELEEHGSAVGIAQAASGGDILFHEVCAELGIPTTLYLALPPDAFARESVAPAEGNWVPRFRAIVARAPAVPVLARTRELPSWLGHVPNYSFWQRNNLWYLNEALEAGGGNLTLIALWNGRAGDGPGGTADMIKTAEARGAKTVVLDTNALFGPGGAQAR